jgi:bifunctional DNase/RNase
VDKIRLDITRLEPSHTQSGAYALVFEARGINSRLPIVIGVAEAQAIAIELEQMKPTRPLTHDVLKSLAESFSISVTEVIIYDIKDAVFHAKIICNSGGKIKEIDSRPSDAVAIAVRFKCPIYTYKFILDQAGVKFEKDGDEDIEFELSKEYDEMPEEESVSISDIKTLSTSELEELLQQAIENEDYERASMIRDELQQRK